MSASANTLTIEGLDTGTLARLAAEANRRGVAMAELARTLLEQSVDSSAAIHHELDSLAGTWSAEDAAAFDAATAATRHVDAELWR